MIILWYICSQGSAETINMNGGVVNNTSPVHHLSIQPDNNEVNIFITLIVPGWSYVYVRMYSTYLSRIVLYFQSLMTFILYCGEPTDINTMVD